MMKRERGRREGVSEKKDAIVRENVIANDSIYYGLLFK